MLAAALALSLVACGGGGGAGDTNTPGGGNGDTTGTEPDTTTQLDTENAIAETPKHIYKDVEENQARAMQNTYLMNCVVGTITDTYFESGNLQIYLPVEQLAQLSKGDNIAIIGKITDVNNETDVAGNITITIVIGVAEIYDGVVSDVAPREDEIFTGVLRGKNDSYENAWNIRIGDSDYLKLIYFADGEDTSTLKSGDKITFTADTVGSQDNPSQYINAKIIER